MQITSKLCLQSENRNVDLKLLANANEKEDKSTSLGSNRGIRDIGGMERLEVIEKKTRTQVLYLSQRVCN